MLINYGLWITGLYAVVLVAAYFGQRSLMYVPDRQRIAPAATGLKGVTEEILTAADGTRLVTWWSPPPTPAAPVVLYFHGNAAGLADRAPRIGAYRAAGYGALMMAYRGYAGSEGRPSEDNNVADALAAHAALIARGVDAKQIVVYGESLGTHMATRVALERRSGALILDAPYTSIVDVAARRFFFLPVRSLIWDRYETSEIISRLTVPVLILHGTRDHVIPVEMGREIARLAPEPKRYVEFPGGMHSNLYDHGAMAVIQKFITEQGMTR
jgi:fermentation-respiration switch protein FrsA (DUF1100 family)